MTCLTKIKEEEIKELKLYENAIVKQVFTMMKWRWEMQGLQASLKAQGVLDSCISVTSRFEHNNYARPLKYTTIINI